MSLYSLQTRSARDTAISMTMTTRPREKNYSDFHNYPQLNLSSEGCQNAITDPKMFCGIRYLIRFSVSSKLGAHSMLFHFIFILRSTDT